MSKQLALVAGGLSLVGAFVAAKKANDWFSRADVGVELIGRDVSNFEECARAQTIEAPMQQVFGLVRDQSMLPVLLPHIKLVNPIDDRRSIWTVAHGRTSALLDVEATTGVDDDHVSFNVTRDGNTIGECTVWLLASGPALNETRVSVRVKFYPLFRKAGSALLRPVIAVEIDTYLNRLKQLVETGEIARSK